MKSFQYFSPYINYIQRTTQGVNFEELKKSTKEPKQRPTEHSLATYNEH